MPDETTLPEISDHAYKRLKERLGIKKKAARRHAHKAYINGISPSEYDHAHLRAWYTGRQEIEESRLILIYQENIYVFSKLTAPPKLITVICPHSSETETRERYLRGDRHFQDDKVNKFNRMRR